MSAILATAGVLVFGVAFLVMAITLVMLSRWLRDLEGRCVRMTTVVAKQAAQIRMLEIHCGIEAPQWLRDVTKPPQQP